MCRYKSERGLLWFIILFYWSKLCTCVKPCITWVRNMESGNYLLSFHHIQLMLDKVDVYGSLYCLNGCKLQTLLPILVCRQANAFCVATHSMNPRGHTWYHSRWRSLWSAIGLVDQVRAGFFSGFVMTKTRVQVDANLSLSHIDVPCMSINYNKLMPLLLDLYKNSGKLKTNY